MKFDHLFFDSGGTLYNNINYAGTGNSAKRRARVHAAILGMGKEVDASRLEEVIEQQAPICRQKAGGHYSFFRLMESVVEALDLPFGPEEAACLADAYAGPRYASWLFPDTKEGIHALDQLGYKMGIIANTLWPGFCMDRAFAGVGLLPYFGTRVYSCDLGIAKPSPQIFRYAERISGMEGRGKRILYVGNDLEADVKGAAGAGWSTAFRRSEGIDSEGLADFDFDNLQELADFCA